MKWDCFLTHEKETGATIFAFLEQVFVVWAAKELNAGHGL